MATKINLKRGISLLNTYVSLPAGSVVNINTGGSYSNINSSVSNGINLVSAEPWVNTSTNQLWVDGMPINVELRLTNNQGQTTLSNIMLGTDGKAYQTLNIPPTTQLDIPVYGLIATDSDNIYSTDLWTGKSATTATYRPNVPNNNVLALVDTSTNGSANTPNPADTSLHHVPQTFVSYIGNIQSNINVGSIVKYYNNSSVDRVFQDITLIDGGVFGNTNTEIGIYTGGPYENRPDWIDVVVVGTNNIFPAPQPGESESVVAGVAYIRDTELSGSDPYTVIVGEIENAGADAHDRGSALYSDAFGYKVLEDYLDITSESAVITIDNISYTSQTSEVPYLQPGHSYYFANYFYIGNKTYVNNISARVTIPEQA